MSPKHAVLKWVTLLLMTCLIAIIALPTHAVTYTVSVGTPGPNVEGSPAVFIIAVSPGLSGSDTVLVEFATRDGSAQAGSDYTALSSSYTFTSDGNNITINVPTNNDALDEDDTESVYLDITRVTGGGIGVGTGLQHILDNDSPPTITINNVTTSEPDTITISMTFSVTLNTPSGRVVTVDYGTSPVSATAGTDYTSQSGTVTFPPGSTSMPVPIPIIGDTLDELDETFRVNLSRNVNANLGSTYGTGTIQDNDPAPTINIADASVTETDSGTQTLKLSLDLTAPSGKSISVRLNSAPVNAAPGTDFLNVINLEVTFSPGQTNKLVSVGIVGDLLDEDDETFRVNLSGAVNVTIGDASALVTIFDNDAPPTINIQGGSVTEVDSGTQILNLSLLLTAPSGKPISVLLNSMPVTATPGADYVNVVNLTVPFSPGQTNKLVSVGIIGDLLDEDNETFTVDLSSPVNVTIGDGSALVTITDNDPLPIVSIIGSTVSMEDAGALAFTLMLNVPSGRPLSVDYKTYDLTAQDPFDYRGEAGTQVIPPGATCAIFFVAVNDDLIYEGTEYMLVDLVGAVNATIDPDAFENVGQINDNETVPVLTVTDVALAESSPFASVTLNLNHPAQNGASVVYGTIDGTAEVGLDYEAMAATANFGTGTQVLINVPLIDDLLDEFDETFAMILHDPVNLQLPDPEAIVTILDNDAPPTAIIEAFHSVPENVGTVEFTVSLSGPSSKPIQIGYETIAGEAMMDVDFYNANGMLDFPPGTMYHSFSVSVIDDALHEYTEGFAGALHTPTNASIGVWVAEVDILDDDPAPVVSVAPITIEEGLTGELVATLDVPSEVPAVVQMISVDGTAIAGTDYTGFSEYLTFMPGETTKNLTITTLDDTLDEDAETFTVMVYSIADADIATPDVTVTIHDNDAAQQEMLVNGGFEGVTAVERLAPWKLINPSGDKVMVDKPLAIPPKLFSLTGTGSFMFKGNPGELAGLNQTVKPNLILQGDETLMLTIPYNTTRTGMILNAKAKVTVVVWLVPQTLVIKPNNSFGTATLGYQNNASDPTLLPAGTLSKVKVILNHRSLSGKLYVDDISLLLVVPDDR